MNLKRLVILLLVVVFALALGIGFSQLRPAVVMVTPPEGAEAVLALAPLEIQFSRPMEPESVRQRLQFDPPVSGDFGWEGPTLTFRPQQPWPSGETVQVSLEPGARSELLGLRLRDGLTWAFTVERPRLAYLWPSDGQADVYLLDPGSGEIERLTVTANGVLDYSFSPDSGILFFSTATPAGGSNLYALDRLSEETSLLLACPQSTCQNPRLSPDGRLLAYQRVASTAGGVAGETQVRLLALEGGEGGEDQLVAALGRPSTTLAWSDSGLLAYHDPAEGAFVLLNPASGEKIRFPNQTGAPGDWSASGERFIAPEILELSGTAQDSPAPPSHLLLFNLADGETENLTLAANLEDTDPAFSPDGRTLAFARKFLDPDRWTPGRQLWLLNLAGEEIRAMTSEALFNHTDFTWREDGQQLAFTRFNQMTLTDPPEIWLLDLDDREPVRLVIGGYAPQWIP